MASADLKAWLFVDGKAGLSHHIIALFQYANSVPCSAGKVNRREAGAEKGGKEAKQIFKHLLLKFSKILNAKFKTYSKEVGFRDSVRDKHAWCTQKERCGLVDIELNWDPALIFILSSAAQLLGRVRQLTSLCLFINP